ncbi:MAG: ACP S-malonyltransferase [Methylococcales bacterium]|nr:ACP S-malonyltransferase [Methylococcales bacterium]
MENIKNELAFVFPGQGSQTIGMLAELAEVYPVIKETFEQASDTLKFDLWRLIQQGEPETLNQTHNTQPAMLAAGIAVWRLWTQQSDIRPMWVAGHSLGEYSALVCSKALAFEAALNLVVQRGLFMQQAVPKGIGAMAAILGLKDQQVIDACAEAANGGIVSAVNFNSPGQVVIAGHTAAVERAMLVAKELGAKRAIKLPVSVPSHCALMKNAAKNLQRKLEKINFTSPVISLIHNTDVQQHTSSHAIQTALTEQLFKPVRWTETINFIHQQQVTKFVEIGPGKVLMGLNKRIIKGATHLAMFDSKSLENVLERLNG